MRKRNNRIWVRLTDQERESLDRRVKKTGLTREAYLRFLISGHVPREQPPPDYYAMMQELNAIGNSINQIARVANRTGFVKHVEYVRYMDEFRDATLRIQQAVTLPEKL